MRKLLLVLAISLCSLPAYTAETKKVCVEVKDKEGKPVKDAKTGETKETCKEIKVHKKLEGTEVPKK